MKKIILSFILLPFVINAETITVKIFNAKNDKEIGIVSFTDIAHGLLIEPSLNSLPPGLHGFHVHAMHSCKDEAMAAGGHFDPKATGKHLGPYGGGHLGDLPALYVNNWGIANHPTLAPRLKTTDLKDRSIMIHAGGDNYSDKPQVLGGGGKRIGCGLVTND